MLSFYQNLTAFYKGRKSESISVVISSGTTATSRTTAVSLTSIISSPVVLSAPTAAVKPKTPPDSSTLSVRTPTYSNLFSI